MLRSTAVGELMTTGVRSLPATATLAEGRRATVGEGHGAFPLVDEAGRCVGLISREDLLLEPPDEGTSLLDLAGRDLVSVTPRTSALDALHRILEETVGHLPVLDEDGALVGICTRTDILRARQRQLLHERPEPGWRPQLRRSRGREVAAEGPDQGGDGQDDQSPAPTERA